jgi:hypothetical protein
MGMANLPPLWEGEIKLGPQHDPTFEHKSPPAITFVPDGVTFKVVSPADRNALLASNPEHRAMLQSRVIWQETKLFTVHVWGVTFINGVPRANSDTDWDYAEAMYQIVLQSLWVLAPARHRAGPGQWVDSMPNSAKRGTIGRYLRFKLEIDTPVLDITNPFVPPGSTYGTIAVTMSGGSAGDVILIETPKV